MLLTEINGISANGHAATGELLPQLTWDSDPDQLTDGIVILGDRDYEENGTSSL
jgi:hypothetical protein